MDWKDYLAFLLGTVAIVSLLRAPAEGSPLARFEADGAAFAADLLWVEGHPCAEARLAGFDLREDGEAVRFVGCGGRGFALRLPADHRPASVWACDEGASRRYPAACSAARRHADTEERPALAPLRRMVGL